MHPIDVFSTLETMSILVDTREQPTQRAQRRYKQFGCKWERHKLDFGDYSAVFTLPDGSLFSLKSIVSIERKQSLDELCQCFTHDRKRFVREFERAQAAGGKIYLLVENASWEKIYAGSYRSQMLPRSLIASILAWLVRYNCQLILCREETSGYLIRDILYREIKERLSS